MPSAAGSARRSRASKEDLATPLRLQVGALLLKRTAGRKSVEDGLIGELSQSFKIASMTVGGSQRRFKTKWSKERESIYTANTKGTIRDQTRVMKL